jgi:Na+/H+ antiporter NhaC
MTELSLSFLSLLPSLVTILLAFYTREVLVALFAGIMMGGITLYLQTGLASSLNIVQKFIVPALSSQSYAVITLIYLWCVGGLLGIWAKTGNAEYFAQQLGKKIAKGRRSALFLAWLLGIIFHQGGTISTILTGTTVKPVADHYKVSHEELSYVVDSTGSPVSSLIPFNPWPLYICSLVLGTIPPFGTLDDCYNYFIGSLCYNFYSIVAITITLLFALGCLPWVGTRMSNAINRSKKYKLLDGPDAHPLISSEPLSAYTENFQPSSYGFLIPIMILLFLSIAPFFAWQFGWIAHEYALMTNEAILIATHAAFFIAYFQGMPLQVINE